jgi:hypothetical protein
MELLDEPLGDGPDQESRRGEHGLFVAGVTVFSAFQNSAGTLAAAEVARTILPDVSQSMCRNQLHDPEIQIFFESGCRSQRSSFD